MAKRFVEIRILRLHHGEQERFVARFRDRLLPLHQEHGIEVVTWGLSHHDKGSFYVVRAYPSVEARQEALDALFGSEEWLMNQEEEVWGMIESYNTCVVEADEALVGAMKAGLVGAPEQNAVPPGWE